MPAGAGMTAVISRLQNIFDTGATSRCRLAAQSGVTVHPSKSGRLKKQFMLFQTALTHFWGSAQKTKSSAVRLHLYPNIWKPHMKRAVTLQAQPAPFPTASKTGFCTVTPLGAANRTYLHIGNDVHYSRAGGNPDADGLKRLFFFRKMAEPKSESSAAGTLQKMPETQTSGFPPARE